MQSQYEARRVSRQRAVEIRRHGTAAARAIVLDTLSGFIIVEPKGSDLGDGPALSPYEADAELQPVWLLDAPAKLQQARQRLGLGAGALATAGA